MEKLLFSIARPSSWTLILVAFLFFGTLTTVFAQAPPIQWQKCLGGSSDDGAFSIQQTYDGGYIVAGNSNSTDGDVTGNHSTYASDYWIVKLDSSGTLIWQKCFGGSDGDIARSIQQTTDGGYIIAGSSSSIDGDVTGHHGTTFSADYWIVKIDSVGTFQWQRSLGGSASDVASSVQQTSDGGYIVAGSSYSNDGDVTGHHGTTSYADYWIVKLNSSGTIVWQKSLGGSSHDYASSIQQTTDGGYIVAGSSRSIDGDVTGHHGTNSYEDFWIVKLNSSGTIVWQKSLGGSGSEGATSVQQTFDGGHIIAGASYSNDGDVTGNHGGYDYWIVKVNSLGTLEWQKSLGGSSGDMAQSIQQTTDSGYVIAGRSDSNDGDVIGNCCSSSYWIVKLNSSGTLVWQESFGGSAANYVYSIQQTNDDGYIMAGQSNSTDGDVIGNHGWYYDYWIVKLGCFISSYSELILDTTYSSSLLSVDTLATATLDTLLSGVVILDIDSIFTYHYLDITTIIKDSTVFTLNQCNNPALDSVLYSFVDADSVFWSHGIFNETIDTIYCPTYIYTETVFDTSYVYEIIFEPTDTLVLISEDTIVDFIIITTDSIFIGDTIIGTMSITDSTVFTMSFCDSSVVDSVIWCIYSNEYSYEPDTVIHSTSDSIPFIPTEMEMVELPTNFKVYPNPFTNEINIELGDETTEIIMFDILGNEIKKTIGVDHTVLSVVDVPSGVYFLKVISKNKTSIIKLVAQ